MVHQYHQCSSQAADLDESKNILQLTGAIQYEATFHGDAMCATTEARTLRRPIGGPKGLGSNDGWGLLDTHALIQARVQNLADKN